MEHLERVQEQPILVNDDKYYLDHIIKLSSMANASLSLDRFFYLYKNDNNCLLDIHVSKLNIARFTKHKIKFSDADSKDYSRQYINMLRTNKNIAFDMIKFKSYTYIVNTFLTGSYIASGIYPMELYDLDVFLYSTNIIYLDYSLVNRLEIAELFELYVSENSVDVSKQKLLAIL
jgi:hypothetical protein